MRSRYHEKVETGVRRLEAATEAVVDSCGLEPGTFEVIQMSVPHNVPYRKRGRLTHGDFSSLVHIYGGYEGGECEDFAYGDVRSSLHELPYVSTGSDTAGDDIPVHEDALARRELEYLGRIATVEMDWPVAPPEGFLCLRRNTAAGPRFFEITQYDLNTDTLEAVSGMHTFGAGYPYNRDEARTPIGRLDVLQADLRLEPMIWTIDKTAEIMELAADGDERVDVKQIMSRDYTGSE